MNDDEGQVDQSKRKGYYVINLIDNQPLYQTISIGLWFKTIEQPDDQSNQLIFGFASDFQADQLDSIQSVFAYRLQFGNSKSVFLSATLGKTASNQLESFNTYQGQWRFGIIVYQMKQKIAYLRVRTGESDLNLSLSFSVGYDILNLNPNLFINIDHAIQVQTANSCSIMKDVQFHYSLDEDYSVDDVLRLQFTTYANGFTPYLYFPLKEWINFYQPNQINAVQIFKNIFNLNQNDAFNGSDRTIEDSDASLIVDQDNTKPYQCYNLVKGKILTIPLLSGYYQILISFILEYSSDIQNGFKIITTDSNLLLQATVVSPDVKLEISIGDVVFSDWILGETNKRQTLVLKQTGTTLTTTNVVYYVDNNLIGNTYLQSQLIVTNNIKIGSEIFENQTFDKFIIRDVFLFPNADALKPEDVSLLQSGSDFLLSDCSLYAQFSFSESFCLVCPDPIDGVSYVIDYNGICIPDTTGQLIDQPLIITNLLVGTKVTTLVGGVINPRALSISYLLQIQQGITSFDFLVIGYFKLSEWNNNQQNTPLIYFEVPGEWYYFMNLYLESDTKVTLKITFDTQNTVTYLSQSFRYTILNTWIAFGVGYKQVDQKVSLVYSDQDFYALNYISQDSMILDQSHTVLNICIACNFPNKKAYSDFVGDVSSVKLIEGFNEYENIQSYLLINEDIMDSIFGNSNYIDFSNPIDIFQLSVSPDIKIESSVLYFFEGLFLSDSSYCSLIHRNPNVVGEFSSLFADNETMSCNMCSPNCLTCQTTKDFCLSCYSGYQLDPTTNACQACDQQSFYDPVNLICIKNCKNVVDLLNGLCISTIYSKEHNSLPSLAKQNMEDSDGFQILLNNILQPPSFVKCYSGQPYNYFNFFGGMSLTTSHIIKKKWNNLPNNYAKEVSFYIVLYDSISINDVLVKINGQSAQLNVLSIDPIATGSNICQFSQTGKTQSLFFVNFVLTDSDSSLELQIQSNVNGFAVRNVKITVKKCHFTCYTCKDGDGPQNCIQCQSFNNIQVKQQCICQQGEYYQPNSCYSSPCYKCVKCSLANCLKCADETGQCIQCSGSYLIQDGICSNACSINYDIAMPSQFCYYSKELALSHFETNKILQYFEFWSSPSDMSQLFSCFGQSFIENIGKGEEYDLSITLDGYMSNYQGYYFDSILLKIDSLDDGSDKMEFYETNFSTPVFIRSQFGDARQKSYCGNPQWGDSILTQSFTFYKDTVKDINFKIKSNFDENKDNESMSLGTIKFYYLKNEPLCNVYQFTQNTQAPQCSQCMTNSNLNGQTFKCECADGYYYSYDFIALIGQCLQCNEACKKCFGSTVYDCNGCVDGYFLDNTGKCAYQCLSGQYKDVVLMQCSPCDPACFECTGPLNNQCLSCYTGTYYYQSKCYSSCQDANPLTETNNWNRSCDNKREQIGDLLFSQPEYFDDSFISSFLKSNSVGEILIYTCQESQMLGLFKQNVQFIISNISAHQTLNLQFKLYFSQSQICLNCQIVVVITDNQLTQSQNVNINQQHECSDQALIDYEFIFSDYQITSMNYIFSISIENGSNELQEILFSIKDIQLNTITCHNTCQSCSGPAETDCTTCFQGSQLNSVNSCVCIQDGYGLGLDFSQCSNPLGCMTCQQCMQPCIECYKNDSQSCLSCPSDMTLFKSSCVDICPQGISIDDVDTLTGQKICRLCSNNCKTCNFNDQCLTCQTGFVYTKETLACTLTCPQYFYYLDPINKQNCLQCDPQCKTCQQNSSNCTTCADEFYMDNSTLLCMPCNSFCETCVGPSNSECIQCSTSDNIILFSPDSITKYCSLNCNEVPGYFVGLNDNFKYACLNCTPNCLSCTSKEVDSCTQCTQGYLLQDGRCGSCNATCQSCSGTTEQDCLSCSTPLYLYQSQCILKCPLNYFGLLSDDNGQECTQCPTACIDCISSDVCTTCQIGYYFLNSQCILCDNNCEVCYGNLGINCQKCRQGYFNQNNKCTNICQPINGIGYYGNLSQRVCQQCDSSCKSCSNKFSYTCTSCFDGFYLLSGSCQKCPTQSKTCQLDDSKSKVISLSCAQGLVLNQQQCLDHCNNGYYIDQSSQSCQLCNNACKLCQDSTTDQCSVCNDGFTLVQPSSCKPCTDFIDSCQICSSQTNCIQCPLNLILFENQCIQDCDKDRGLYKDNNQCKPCVSPCLKCQSATQCLLCGLNFYAGVDFSCKTCNSQCNTCDGATQFQCTSCNSGFYLQVSQGVGNVCTLQCLTGYYPDNVSRKCLQCDKSCSDCTTGTKCTQCSQSYYQVLNQDLCQICKNTCNQCVDDTICMECKPGYFLLNNDCYSSCPDGQIGVNQNCMSCDSTCQSCFGTPSSCTSCQDGFYLSGNVCIPCDLKCSICSDVNICQQCNTEDQLCKLDCENDGFYPDKTTNQCEQCDQTCQNCQSSSPKACISCIKSYYFSGLGIVGSCVKCFESCSECFGPQSTDCTACNQGVKFLSPNTCVSCPQYTYFDATSQQCLQCSDYCETCFGPSQNNCITCKANYFINIDTSICSQCPIQCTICFNNEFCTQCQTGYSLLENKSCVNPCPVGMRDLNGICLCHQTCSKCISDATLSTSICLRCQSNSYLLNGQNAACIGYDDCQNFRDLINNQCVQQCPDNTKYIDLENKTCSFNSCQSSLLKFNDKYCISKCPQQYYVDYASSSCMNCNSKCLDCTGPDANLCSSCTSENYYHPEISTCGDSCIPGFVQQGQDMICLKCRINCKLCTADLVILEGKCLDVCPVGYSKVGNQCIYIPSASVQITNIKNDEIVSINSDLEVNTELFASSSIESIKWTITESLDKQFSSDFSQISSNSLTQVIPFILLSSSNTFVLKITVTLNEGTSVTDQVRIKTTDSLQEGKFSVNQVTGVSFQTVFIFTVSDWSSSSDLYFDLNFYQLLGIQQPDTSTSSSSQFDFVKDKLFKLHENIPLTSDKQIIYTFQPFDSDVSLISELKVFTGDGSMQTYKYLIIKLNQYNPVNGLSDLNNSLQEIQNNQNDPNVGVLIFNFSFLFKMVIFRDSKKADKLSSQIKLRQSAKVIGISNLDLPSCDNQIDCFGNGNCVNNILFQQVCFCFDGFYGQNCEWTTDQSNTINNTFTLLNNIFQSQNISSILQIQICENMSYYTNVFYLNISPFQFIIDRFISLFSIYVQSDLGQVSGQILQRSSSTLTSQLFSINYNVKQLLDLTSTLQNQISKNLNIGEKLISQSDTNESLSYPFLQQVSSSSRMRRLRRKRFLDNSSSTQNNNIKINFNELTISFPPQVIQTNKKQVIQAQMWKQNPRENPLSITQSISVSLTSSGEEIPVNNLSQPIILTIPKLIPTPVSTNSNSIACTYYDSDTNSFKSDGCTFVKETILNVICSCIHLTDFTAQTIPQQINSTFKLSDLTQTITDGNQLLLTKVGQQMVVTELPVLQIGQRTVNLVNQLNILQSGSAINLVKQNTIILFEDQYYTSDISDEWEEDYAPIQVEESQNETQKVSQILVFNRIELLFYIIIAFSVFFLLAMRTSLQFNFIHLSSRQLKMFEANYFDNIENIIYSKDKPIIKNKVEISQNPRLQNSLSLSPKSTIQNKRNSQKNNNKTKQKKNSTLLSTELIKIQLKDEEYKLQESQSLGQIFNNNNNSNKHISHKKSQFSQSKMISTDFHTQTSQSQITVNSQEDKTEIHLIQDIQEKFDNLNNYNQIDNYNQINNNVSLKNKKSFFKYVQNQKLPTIMDLNDESNEIDSQKSSIKIKNRKKADTFISMQRSTNNDQEYENYISNINEKQINPRGKLNNFLFKIISPVYSDNILQNNNNNIYLIYLVLSIQNIRKGIKLLNKLKRNLNILNGIDHIDNSSSETISIQQRLEKQKEQLKKSLFQFEKDQKMNSFLNSQQILLKQNKGYQYITSILRKNEAELHLIELQKQRKLIEEIVNKKMKDTENNKIKNGKLEFGESGVWLIQENKQMNAAKDSKLGKTADRRLTMKEMYQKNQKDEIELGRIQEILENIEKQVEQKEGYIKMIDNVQDRHLQISPFNIFQVYSLVQYDDKLFSTRFTKCLYIICQITIAVTVHILFLSTLHQSFKIKTSFGIFDLYLLRVLVMTAFSYFVPYFFFGCLTNIFASVSKKVEEKLDFVSINQLRKYFMICYIFMGLFQMGIYLFGIYHFREDQYLQNNLSFVVLIIDLCITLTLSMVVIDGINYILFTYLLNDKEKQIDGKLNNILACRGFYYYKGFDNLKAYEQNFFAQVLFDVSNNH